MSAPKSLFMALCRGAGNLLGRTYLRIAGWELVGAPPEAPKHVMIAAPHTTNWDLPLMLACAWSYGSQIHWIGKKEIFDMWLIGRFLRWTGGVSIDRAAAKDTVAQVVAAFQAATHMHLCIAPEATRSRRDHWRSGFYHIAVGAGVPIACGFIDYATRRTGYGPVFMPTGDIRADMDRIREFYGPIKSRYPENQSPVRLAEEDAPPA